MALRKAQLLYLTGDAGSLGVVADIMVWILSTGCTDDAASCSSAQQQASGILWKMQQASAGWWGLSWRVPWR